MKQPRDRPRSLNCWQRKSRSSRGTTVEMSSILVMSASFARDGIEVNFVPKGERIWSQFVPEKAPVDFLALPRCISWIQTCQFSEQATRQSRASEASVPPKQPQSHYWSNKLVVCLLASLLASLWGLVLVCWSASFGSFVIATTAGAFVVGFIVVGFIVVGAIIILLHHWSLFVLHQSSPWISRLHVELAAVPAGPPLVREMSMSSILCEEEG